MVRAKKSHSRYGHGYTPDYNSHDVNYSHHGYGQGNDDRYVDQNYIEMQQRELRERQRQKRKEQLRLEREQREREREKNRHKWDNIDFDYLCKAEKLAYENIYKCQTSDYNPSWIGSQLSSKDNHNDYNQMIKDKDPKELNTNSHHYGDTHLISLIGQQSQLDAHTQRCIMYQQFERYRYISEQKSLSQLQKICSSEMKRLNMLRTMQYKQQMEFQKSKQNDRMIIGCKSGVVGSKDHMNCITLTPTMETLNINDNSPKSKLNYMIKCIAPKKKYYQSTLSKINLDDVGFAALAVQEHQQQQLRHQQQQRQLKELEMERQRQQRLAMELQMQQKQQAQRMKELQAKQLRQRQLARAQKQAQEKLQREQMQRERQRHNLQVHRQMQLQQQQQQNNQNRHNQSMQNRNNHNNNRHPQNNNNNNSSNHKTPMQQLQEIIQLIVETKSTFCKQSISSQQAAIQHLSQCSECISTLSRFSNLR